MPYTPYTIFRQKPEIPTALFPILINDSQPVRIFSFILILIKENKLIRGVIIGSTRSLTSMQKTILILKGKRAVCFSCLMVHTVHVEMTDNFIIFEEISRH